MVKDKWLIRFYIFLILVFLSIYYTGEARNRRLKELGFKICEINGIQTWSDRCPEEKGLIQQIGENI